MYLLNLGEKEMIKTADEKAYFFYFTIPKEHHAKMFGDF